VPDLRRRTFLQWLAAGSALPLVGTSACTDDATDRTFPQGVASGDPTPDSVLLWTRVEASASERVRYEFASDPEFKTIVASDESDVDGETDHTLRVEVDGLAAGTTYWYRFVAGGVTSPVGRTKTAPPPDADVPLRIALASCQDFGGRWFHAWRDVVARDDIDLVLFIGDYIYETIGILGVEPPANRTVDLPDGLLLEDPVKGRISALTLADYRTLYRAYRRDPDLRAVHAHFPFVSLWDDHEFANDCWQDHATDFDDEYGDEASPDRRAAATRAWYEFSAVRRPYDATAGFPADLRIYRNFRWGKHVELVLLDQRYYRSDHLIPEGPIDREVGHIQMNSAFGARTFCIKDVFDQREAAAMPRPTMLGADQLDWAISTINGSTATWKVVASPLAMTQMVLDLSSYAQLPDQFRNRFYFKTDQWDGYRSERRALLEACASVENMVVLSGDLHGFYASELHADFDAPGDPICPEYVVSAISAATVDVQLDAVIESNVLLKGLGLAGLVPEFDANLLATNPHILYAESTKNGLAIVEIGAQQVDVTFQAASDVTKPIGKVASEVAFRTPLGSRQIIPS
jgi:alkaline phosphatase D